MKSRISNMFVGLIAIVLYVLFMRIAKIQDVHGIIISNQQTNVTTYFLLLDSSGDPVVNVTVTNIDLYYVEDLAAISAKVDATALVAANSAHADNKVYNVGQGLYRIDWPDAAFDGGIGTRVQLLVLDGAASTFLTTVMELELSPPTSSSGGGWW